MGVRRVADFYRESVLCLKDWPKITGGAPLLTLFEKWPATAADKLRFLSPLNSPRVTAPAFFAPLVSSHAAQSEAILRRRKPGDKPGRSPVSAHKMGVSTHDSADRFPSPQRGHNFARRFNKNLVDLRENEN